MEKHIIVSYLFALGLLATMLIKSVLDYNKIRSTNAKKGKR